MSARALSRWWLLTALALAPQLSRASTADAFEDKIKPVSGQLYTKAGKLEIVAPTFQLSFNDAFYSKYMLAGKLGYHFSEYLGVAITGAAGLNGTTGSTTVCPNDAPCRPATEYELYRVPGKIPWMAAAEVEWSPLYGKLNLLGELAAHFDLFLVGGVDLVSYRQVVVDATASTPPPGNALAVGGHFGLGTRIFVASGVALFLEAKDVIYSVSGLPSGKVQNQLFADFGVTFLLPVAR